MESILTSIKKLLGIEDADEYFDTDIIIHINSTFMTLTQLGVGPSIGFIIINKDAVWTNFVEDPIKLAAVKSYIYLKVKLIFDPPSSSFVLDSMNKQIIEYEWRLTVEAEPVPILFPEEGVTEID